MGKINTLSDESLEANLKKLISQEREILSEILNHIREVDLRKLHLKKAYPSLFAYLTDGLGYSEGSAQRRIDAVRLIKEVPSVQLKIESGDLKLHQVSLVQKSVRQLKKAGAAIANSRYQEMPPAQIKAELIQQISGKSTVESEKIIVESLGFLPKLDTRSQPQSDGSVRLEITLSKEQWEKLQKAKDLLSHSLPNGGGVVEFLEHVSEKVIKQKMGVVKIQTVVGATSTGQKTHTATGNSFARQRKLNKASTVKDSIAATPMKSEKPQLKVIAAKVRKAVFNKDQSCQYKDPCTGKICGGRHQLQLDHIQPRWADGISAPENLQLLCAQHNRHRYRIQSGVRSISN